MGTRVLPTLGASEHHSLQSHEKEEKTVEN